jgi:hypothetical protein
MNMLGVPKYTVNNRGPRFRRRGGRTRSRPPSSTALRRQCRPRRPSPSAAAAHPAPAPPSLPQHCAPASQCRCGPLARSCRPPLPHLQVPTGTGEREERYWISAREEPQEGDAERQRREGAARRRREGAALRHAWWCRDGGSASGWVGGERKCGGRERGRKI